jgi:hypothetical protein
MPAENIQSCVLENAFSELIRKAVRAEIREIVKRDEDRLLTIEQVAQRLAVSKDWVYRLRNGKRYNDSSSLFSPWRRYHHGSGKTTPLAGGEGEVR